jgi:hypothetical protein
VAVAPRSCRMVIFLEEISRCWGSVYNLACLGRIDVIMYNRAPLTCIGAESR